MRDFLVELSHSPTAQQVVKSLGLPIPLPPVLERSFGATPALPFVGRTFGVCSPEQGPLAVAAVEALSEAGADIVTADRDQVAQWKAAAQAYSRVVSVMDPESGQKLSGLVFDASHFDSILQLDWIYRSMRPFLRTLRKGARIVIISPVPSEKNSAEMEACARGLEGFMRSLSKEMGKKGIGVILCRCPSTGSPSLAGALRYFLSGASAYVTGQPITLGTSGKKLTAGFSWDQPLAGKTALVTGASRGIGRSTAITLAADGAKVICLDRLEEADSLAELTQKINGVALCADITAPDAGQLIQDLIEKESGGLDIIVHNAGVTRDKTLARMSEEQWNLTLSVNLQAIVRVTGQLRVVFNDHARIVLLSSIAGIAGNVGQTNYALTKAALVGLVSAWSNDFKKKGITVNAVAPGFIETRMTAAIPFAIREVARRLNAFSQGGLPGDVAEAIKFFALPSSTGVSGQVLRICGGALVGA
ncbi:MAG: 3-oxoacyl-ACP reductase [Myxococcota bacterium]|nr:3-oxoacyl-ACP reductase [Myxococcota bacterium]